LSPTDTLIHAAGRWFLDSGIRDANGGVARYYRSDLGRNAPISTEITGYAVSTFLFLHKRTGDAAYLEAALRAARFLTRTAWDGKLRTFPFELVNVKEPAFAYFFDCGIIVRGLLAAWRATGDSEFREVAIAAGRGMLGDFAGNGAIHPILTLPEKRPLGYETSWSRSPGCYQLKAAMAWLELFQATGEREFQCGYEAALKAALANQAGFLETERDPWKQMDRLHAYGYFLEGLAPVLDRPECFEAFRNGVERMARLLHEIEAAFVRSDVYAQLLRARMIGEATGVLKLDHTTAAEEAAQTRSFQLAAGGFLFGRKNGEPMPFVNPVSTAFCVQALAMWDDRSAEPGPKCDVI
jgi:hypothetical protein